MENLYNGECIYVINNNNIKCDIIVTDPPYLFEKGGNSKMLGDGEALHRNNRTMLNSEFGEREIYNFLDYTKKTMDKPQWYIFCSEKQITYYLKWCDDNNFLFNILAWCKPLSILNRNRFSTNIEYIVRIYKYGCPLNRLPSDNNTYYSKWKVFDIVRGNKKMHPQQKPIELISQLIELSTKEGDVVLDPFMGSGSTGVACMNTNRNFIGIELDNTYYEIAGKRISEALRK